MIKAAKKGGPVLNIDRLVRSAAREEAYCAFILDGIGLVDGSDYSIEWFDWFWDEEVANSDLSVKEFCLVWKAKLAKGEAA